MGFGRPRNTNKIKILRFTIYKKIIQGDITQDLKDNSTIVIL